MPKFCRQYVHCLKFISRHFMFCLSVLVCLNTEIGSQANCQILSTNSGITCIAYSFSPLHEMPDIFRHFMKCLTSRIACKRIYMYVSFCGVLFAGLSRLFQRLGAAVWQGVWVGFYSCVDWYYTDNRDQFYSAISHRQG